MTTQTKNINNMDKTVVDEALTRQVATVMLGGATIGQAAKQLGISNAAIRRITSSEKYKEIVSKTAEDQLAPALAEVKSQLSKLSGKAVRVLEKAMDRAIQEGEGLREGLEASKVVLKAVGLSEEKEVQQDTTIQIVMPSGIEVPVTYETNTEKED